LPIHGTPFQTLKETPSWLCWVLRGVEVPEELTDEPLDDLPYVELFYRYLHERSYAVSHANRPGA
jgi:hypothetical protein